MTGIVACLLGGLLVGCGGSTWPPFDRAALTPPEAWPDADRVVLLDEVRVRFHGGGEAGEPVADVTQHRRVWYRTARGAEGAGVSVGYSPGLRDLLGFEGRIVPAAGDEVAFGRADAVDLPAFDRGTLFSDARMLVHQPGIRPGAVIESRTAVRYHDMRLWSQRQAFSGASPGEVRRLVVELPPGWRARWLAREGGQVIEWAPDETAAPDGGQRLVWSRRETPPRVRERHAPPGHLMAPLVSVQLARWTVGGRPVDGPETAADVAGILHRLQAPRLAPSDAIRSRVEALLEGAGPSPAERAERLHRYVRDQVRYVSIQLGMGGWIPHPAAEVLEAGYGDCKDQASLLGAMLAVAGIPSRQVTVYAHAGWPKPYGLPTIAGNANHQVVVVDLPDGPVIADPTRDDVPFGEVPAELQGADILPTIADGSAVERVPLDAPDASLITLTLTLKSDAAGRARGGLDASAHGNSARGLRDHLRTERGAPLRKGLDDRLELRELAVRRVLSTAGVEPTAARAPVTVKASVKRKGVFGAESQVWTISADSFLGGWLPRLDAGARRHPIVLGPRRTRRQRVELALPPGRAVSALPAPVAVETDFATYRLSWTAGDGAVALQRELVWTRPGLAADEADALRAFVDAVARADARAIILRPAEAAP